MTAEEFVRMQMPHPMTVSEVHCLAASAYPQCTVRLLGGEEFGFLELELAARKVADEWQKPQ